MAWLREGGSPLSAGCEVIRPRSKPRRGRIRLKGEAMAALRREVFERDGYQCQHMKVVAIPWEPGKFYRKCNAVISWKSGHLAHIISRGRGGDDSLENCVTKCAHCHLVIEHTNGGAEKIVPCKAGEQ